MAYSVTLRCADLVRTDASEELSASFITVTRIGELGRKLAGSIECCTRGRQMLVTASVLPSSPILVNLMKEALSASETVGSYKSHMA
jgi:hypothetical protein